MVTPSIKTSNDSSGLITINIALADTVENKNPQHIYTVVLPDKPDMIPQKHLVDESGID
jgi:hypothetical protein